MQAEKAKLEFEGKPGRDYASPEYKNLQQTEAAARENLDAVKKQQRDAHALIEDQKKANKDALDKKVKASNEESGKTGQQPQAGAQQSGQMTAGVAYLDLQARTLAWQFVLALPKAMPLKDGLAYLDLQARTFAWQFAETLLPRMPELNAAIIYLTEQSNKFAYALASGAMPTTTTGASVTPVTPGAATPNALQFNDLNNQVTTFVTSLTNINMMSPKIDEQFTNLNTVMATLSEGLSSAATAAKDYAAKLASAPIPGAVVTATTTGASQLGGYIPGFGGGDTVPWRVEGGEYVVRKEAVRKYGSNLFSAYNNMLVGVNSRLGNIDPSKRSIDSFKDVASEYKNSLNNQISSQSIKINNLSGIGMPNVKVKDVPVRKFELNIGGVPFKGLTTEQVLNDLERGLRRKKLVRQN
jgi:hypothetical protein